MLLVWSGPTLAVLSILFQLWSGLVSAHESRNSRSVAIPRKKDRQSAPTGQR